MLSNGLRNLSREVGIQVQAFEAWAMYRRNARLIWYRGIILGFSLGLLAGLLFALWSHV